MEISLAAEPLFHLGTLPITNTLVMSWLVVVLLAALGFIVGRKVQAVPRGLQNIFEAFLETLLSFADGVTGDRKKTLRFLPLVATIFLFVLFSNAIELLPGLGSIGIYEEIHGKTVLVPFIRSSSADLNVTIMLALVSVAASHYFGMKQLGTFTYWQKFFVAPWKQPFVIGTFVGILELVAELAKVISFSFRLFGNIFAGEVLLLVVGSLAPFFAPLPFLFLEIFVGIVQALVFAMLTLVFCTIATQSHGEEAHAH